MNSFDYLPDELRKHIFSYLRNRAQDYCAKCNIVCVWDKKIRDIYIVRNNGPKHVICRRCWIRSNN